MDKKIICIGCPMGCEINVKTQDGKITDISGYTCRKGEEYARTEAVDPRRTLTTTMRLSGGKDMLIPVKSDKPIKKDMMFACMKVINAAEAKAPVKIGDVLITNILDSGIDIVATGHSGAV